MTPFDKDTFWGTTPSCTTTTSTTKMPPHGCENLSPEDSSPQVRLTKDPSRMSPPQNFSPSPSVTSLQASAAGRKHSSLPASSPPGDCGPGHALANLSPRQAKEKGLLMSATFGQPSSGSSSSVVLQQCLANKLRQRLDVNGSPEYVLTWKDWPMKWGPPICALRASARRTSGNGCSGWPTTKAKDGREWSPNAKPESSSGHGLGAVAQMAGWCSPTCQDGSRGGLPPRPQDTGVPLSQQAALAGCATPDANAMNPGEGLETWDARQIKNKVKHGNGNGAGMPIAVQALTMMPSGGWTTPQAHDSSGRSATQKGIHGKKHGCACLALDALGTTINSSPAATVSRGALNPALSRWLQGYPVEWCQSAIAAFRKLKQQAKRGSPGSKGTATRLSAKSPQNSSSPPKPPGTTGLENFWG